MWTADNLYREIASLIQYGPFKDKVIKEEKPIFVISDTHIAGGEKKDSLTINKEKLLWRFLDFVEKQDAELIITGDFLELWHSKLEKILKSHYALFGRLNQIHCTYILGNHDSELGKINRNTDPWHPFFERISQPVTRTISNKKFKFLHGHEVDPFIFNDRKNLYKALGGIVNILQFNTNTCTVTHDICSDILLEFGEFFIGTWNRLFKFLTKAGDQFCNILPDEEVAFLKRAGRTRCMLRRYREELNKGLYDIAIVGHTHKAGQFSDWYYNSGSWTGRRSNFLHITPDAEISVFDWTESGPRQNKTLICG